VSTAIPSKGHVHASRRHRVGRTRGVVICAALTAALWPGAAAASELVGRNASDVRLQVDAQGRALVTLRSAGQSQSVAAWGAVNALPPSPSRPQVAFKLSRGGGIGPNVCRRYSGPPLPWLVTGCTAPDGTHWALQSWQRTLPNYGVTPTAEQAAWELRLSHWSGPIAQLEIKTDWSYRRFHHLYGRLSYRGQPVHGFRSTPRGVPLDAYGRNIFVDTLDSPYGPGWKRENSFLAHRPTGGFCYGFHRHGPHPSGNGSRYRATVIGPGVTPDVAWAGPAPGSYNRSRDLAANLEQRRILAGDRLCKIN
jgi:hypothetical protein